MRRNSDEERYTEENINETASILLQRLKNGMISFSALNPVGLQFLFHVFDFELYQGFNSIVMSDEALQRYSEELWEMFSGREILIVNPEPEDWERYC